MGDVGAKEPGGQLYKSDMHYKKKAWNSFEEDV
jgi:hypothetical protein